MISFMFLFLASFILFENHPVFSEELNERAIGVNDAVLDLQGQKAVVMQKKVTYAPMEPMLKALQVSITYESNGNILLAQKADKWMRISLLDNSITTSVTGSTNQILYIKEKPFVPVRFVGEFFGYTVVSLPKHKVARLFNGKQRYNDSEFITQNRKMLDSYFGIYTGKIAYLTFDDGPNPNMAKILDILKSKQALATFFMIEPNMGKYPNVVKRIVEEGHYPGLHSVSHDKNKLYKGNTQNVAYEMELTRKTLVSIADFNSYLTRVPYGSKPYMSQAYRDHMAGYGFKMWDWNIDTQDWKYGKNNPRKIVENVKNGIQKLEKNNEPLVILFHGTNGTISILPEVIDLLRNKGYQLVPYDPNQHPVVNFWKDSRL